MQFKKVALATTAALSAVFIATSAVDGATAQPAGPATGAHSVIADYHGKKIDLAKGWQGAQVCVEYPDAKVNCYSTVAESDRATAAYRATHAMPAAATKAGVSPQSINDCLSPWVCLWQNVNYSGHKLEWSTPGTKTLGKWGFRDKTSSACNNRPIYGATLTDYRDYLPDPELIVPLGSCLSNFTKISYPYGGNWNDKADALTL